MGLDPTLMDSNLYVWSDPAIEFPATFCENGADSPFRLNRLQTEPESAPIGNDS